MPEEDKLKKIINVSGGIELPGLILNMVKLINGQVIEQVSLQATGHTPKEAKELFDHSLSKVDVILQAIDKNEAKKK